MLGSKNKVIAGDYNGYRVKANWRGVKFKPPIFSQNNNQINIDKNFVRSYELVKSDYRKSAVSTVVRGMIGKYLLGLVGLIGGTASAKNTGLYTVSLEFFNGKRSLIDIDDKTYRALIKHTF